MEAFTKVNKLDETTRFLFHFISYVWELRTSLHCYDKNGMEVFTDVTKPVEAFGLEEWKP